MQHCVEMLCVSANCSADVVWRGCEDPCVCVCVCVRARSLSGASSHSGCHSAPAQCIQRARRRSVLKWGGWQENPAAMDMTPLARRRRCR